MIIRLLPTYNLHIFVYGSAECITISLECTKVKHIILNNFAKYLNKSEWRYVYNPIKIGQVAVDPYSMSLALLSVHNE